ncbi:hypothetical protein EAH72_13980 [Pseudomonas caspiana]|nr:hypothetical protein EAH72_13980 [Pseudomonas caspiana]
MTSCKPTSGCSFSYKRGSSALYGLRREKRVEFVAGDVDRINGWCGPVGAGLLAKADCQSTSMVNVRPPSRASPLPQVLRRIRARR